MQEQARSLVILRGPRRDVTSGQAEFLKKRHSPKSEFPQ